MTVDQRIDNGDLRSAAAVSIDQGDPWTAQVVQGWDVYDVPHGGYLLAILTSAARHLSEHRAPIAVSANFLSVPNFGQAEVEADLVRAGKHQTTVQTRLFQTDTEGPGGEQVRIEKVRATITLGTLGAKPTTQFLPSAAMPSVGGPDDGSMTAQSQAGEEQLALIPRLYDHIEARFPPDTGLLAGRFDGPPRLGAWCRLSGGHPTDELATLVFTDGLLPSIVAHQGFTVGHVPTLQLTAYLHGRPSSDWIFVEASTAIRGGNFVEEDYRLWDVDGQLVATSRQLALVRDG